MTESFDAVAFAVFAAFFVLVAVIGFTASRWRRADLNSLDEWGLGGRRFGGWVTWFLLGGDIYTAYTFIAVPGLLFGAGALGFYPIAYTIMAFVFVFLTIPRLWSVAKRRGYVTAADFVQGRYGHSGLSLAVACTSTLTMMPYIALQIIGLEVAISALGLKGEIPVFVAFGVLAAYTYKNGLRAPALVAVVKDILVYVTVIVAVIYIPIQLGGFGNIFAAAEQARPGAVIPTSAATFTSYVTLAIGSAMAMFLYPHTLTGAFGAKSGHVIRRNMAYLAPYTVIMGGITLLGYMVIAAGIKPASTSSAVPELFVAFFPSWFLGVALAAIGIGALVPAAIMSIGAGNIFARNVYGKHIRPDASERKQATVAKLTSLFIKVGALAFVVVFPREFSINLQLLAGIWILQTLPSVIVGLFRRLDPKALLIGWATGMILGTAMAASQRFTSIFPLKIGTFELSAYAGVLALVANLAVTLSISFVIRRSGRATGTDETRDDDYSDFSGSAMPAPEATETGSATVNR